MSTILWVAHETGSSELQPALARMGLPATITTLDSADFAFQGMGPDGPVQVGIERKTTPDLIDSLKSGRLTGVPNEANKGGQLARLTNTYDYVFLVIEGGWETSRDGRLVQRRKVQRPLAGGMSEDALVKRCISICLQAGVFIWQTTSQQQTERFIASFYRWFTDKAWDEHSTLKAVYRPATGMLPISRFRAMMMCLPDLGLEGTKAAEKAFDGNIIRALTADLTTWATLPVEMKGGVKRLGESRAARIVEACRKLRGER